ncbi:MAG: hypothetical protein AB7F86_15225 [Bdellovibrionales bacterium]
MKHVCTILALAILSTSQVARAENFLNVDFGKPSSDINRATTNAYRERAKAAAEWRKMMAQDEVDLGETIPTQASTLRPAPNS